MDAGRRREVLRHVAEAEERFQRAIADLDDDGVRRPSLLPDWSVGHVLTHMARNADSHRRRTEAAIRGEMVDQYVGGPEGRAAEIETGAGRPATALLADVAESSSGMLDAWRDAPDHAWVNVTRDVSGTERPLHDLPGRRWQGLEVHLVDLGIGVTHRDWPDSYVSASLPAVRRTMARMVEPQPLPDVTSLGLDDRDELAWLYSRHPRTDLPALPSWG